MSLSMRICLLLISLFVLTAARPAPSNSPQGGGLEDTGIKGANDGSSQSVTSNTPPWGETEGALGASSYNVVMQARGNEVTAICFLMQREDGSVVGSFVNEFGVKVFDFTYSDSKAKVVNVMGPLNRWYIRRVLNKDFSFILSNINRNENVVEKKRNLTILPNGDIYIRNERFKIYYTFSKTKL